MSRPHRRNTKQGQQKHSRLLQVSNTSGGSTGSEKIEKNVRSHRDSAQCQDCDCLTVPGELVNRVARNHSNMLINTTKLPYGIYFGSDQIRREVPGFSVSLLIPASRAEDVPLHTHEHASFVFVLSGAYMSGADGATKISSEPMLVFNPAGTTHRDSFVRPTGGFLALSISDESLRVALNGAVLPTSAQAFASGPGFDTALRVVQESVSPKAAATVTIEALCWELLASVAGEKLWPNNDQISRLSWIGRARELLQERCSDSLQISGMAQELGVHPVYFARIFRQVFRCTPGEYRLRCRLRNALASMHTSSITLSEIALGAGFFDQSHFSKAFREHFGMPPQAYRRQLSRRCAGL
jgi:AraC family transcriptional regulator